MDRWAQMVHGEIPAPPSPGLLQLKEELIGGFLAEFNLIFFLLILTTKMSPLHPWASAALSISFAFPFLLSSIALGWTGSKIVAKTGVALEVAFALFMATLVIPGGGFNPFLLLLPWAGFRVWRLRVLLARC